MERKLKIMGLYIGILFFVAILLILVTSFSNSKINPSYDVEESENQYQVSFNKTMEENVNSLTENNRILNEKNIELNKQLEEKDNIIKTYEEKYNDDVINLQKAMSLYINNNVEEAKTTFELINRENLDLENETVYDNLLNKLQ